ncbi:MAG: hypothetical protein ACO3R6_03710, partial [Lutimaribacter sp.]
EAGLQVQRHQDAKKQRIDIEERQERRFILGFSVINNPPKTRQSCMTKAKLQIAASRPSAPLW